MAKQLQNNKGFLVIQMPWREYVAITDSWGLADCCGQNSCEDDVFYIAVLDSFFCKMCYDAWYSTAKHYKVDMEKERYNWNNKVSKLRDLGVFDEVRN